MDGWIDRQLYSQTPHNQFRPSPRVPCTFRGTRAICSGSWSLRRAARCSWNTRFCTGRMAASMGCWCVPGTSPCPAVASSGCCVDTVRQICWLSPSGGCASNAAIVTRVFRHSEERICNRQSATDPTSASPCARHFVCRMHGGTG